MRPPRHFCCLAVGLSVLLTATLAHASASIVLREKYPVRGESTELFVQDEDGTPVAGAVVKVTYRPGSSVEAEAAVGNTNDGGRVPWTPEKAGIATVSAVWGTAAGDTLTASTNVSVKFDSPPVSGLIIMVMAGLLLVGGSFKRIWHVLRSTP